MIGGLYQRSYLCLDGLLMRIVSMVWLTDMMCIDIITAFVG